MTKMFSEHAMSALKASGWCAGRRVSVESIETAIRQEFRLSPSGVVHSFMSEFSGICLKALRAGSLLETACFNPLLGARLIKRELAVRSNYEKLCVLSKGPLYPVGMHANMSCILMRDDGAVFALDDLSTWFGFWGATPREAIEHACAPLHSLVGIGLDDNLSIHPGEFSRFQEELRDAW
jgi:hypothetical protein